jgi:predicted TIM-barrel fold metal-dependent hydrolase
MADRTTMVIDGDGHIVEDHAAIASYFPKEFVGDASTGRSGMSTIFPPGDHLHAAQPLRVLPGSFQKPDAKGWREFADNVGIDIAVLYPSAGLHYGHIVSRDWAIATCEAYNNWLHDTYTSVDPLFKGVALIPMRDPEAAVVELRRAVEELGFVGAMLPTSGLPLPLGDKGYWPLYEEASRLGCAMAAHGGAHDRIGLDHMNVYAGVNALGHPITIAAAFASILLNGVFDKFRDVRFGFLEAGVGWILMALERLERGYETHIPLDPRNELMQLEAGEDIVGYIRRLVADGRLFIGCEGSEPLLPIAIEQLGEGFAFFSSDYPHEVSAERCTHEIEEVLASDDLAESDKLGVLRMNAARFYGLDVS